MIDSHAHLVMDRFDGDRAEAIRRAHEAGVTSVLNVGTTLADSRRGLELARQHPGIHAACGIHPHEARAYSAGTREELSTLAREPGIIAIGETGLDFHYEFSPRAAQEEAFRGQIRLALAAGLPVIVHSREAEDRTLSILREESRGELRGVMHCFTGSLPFAEACLALGLHVSFSGIVTFRNAGPLRDIAVRIPPDRLLVETDSPYLAPEPYRGRRCEPAMLPRTLEELARIRGSDLHEVARITEANYRTLFLDRPRAVPSE